MIGNKWDSTPRFKGIVKNGGPVREEMTRKGLGLGFRVSAERQELQMTNDSFISSERKKTGHQYAPYLTVSPQSPYCNLQTFIFL